MTTDNHIWQRTLQGRMSQIALKSGDDIAHLAQLDRKEWLALSMPTTGIRFDQRMLELMDTDHDGRVRADEVIGAIEFLKSKNVDLNSLFKPDEADEKALASVLERQGDLAKAKPSDAELKAMADWEAKGKEPLVAVLGADTAAAEAALAAVEKTIDAFFTPPEDLPLVTEAPDVALPLKDHLNPKHLEAILDFSEKCVKPILGDAATLSRLDWKKVKTAFAPYRDWVASKPALGAAERAGLDDEERVIRYRMHLLELLENYVNMERLYEPDQLAIFQTGVLRIDAKELHLCFHVDSEAAHSALADKSKCCVIYLKLTRPSEGAERHICAVVTAGTVGGLYVGRNGVFNDRDGKDWEAVITKVVEAQVSLAEAFWAPWRKLGEGISGMIKKFLGDKQSAVQASAAAGKLPPEGNGGGAAMASSVAAIGIGVGMMGAALASVLAAVKGMGPLQILLAIIAIIAVVSLPSVILTWFKLRARDLGAILNAGSWAVNRPMYFSMRLARTFTRCAPSVFAKLVAILAAIIVIGLLAWAYCPCCNGEKCKLAAEPAPAAEAAPAGASAADAAPAPAAPAADPAK